MGDLTYTVRITNHDFVVYVMSLHRYFILFVIYIHWFVSFKLSYILMLCCFNYKIKKQLYTSIFTYTAKRKTYTVLYTVIYCNLHIYCNFFNHVSSHRTISSHQVVLKVSLHHCYSFFFFFQTPQNATVHSLSCSVTPDPACVLSAELNQVCWSSGNTDLCWAACPKSLKKGTGDIRQELPSIFTAAFSDREGGLLSPSTIPLPQQLPRPLPVYA